MNVSPVDCANNREGASCSLRQRSRYAPAFRRRLRHKENRRLSDAGQVDRISNTTADEHKPRASIAPFPGRNESQVLARFLYNNERSRRIPHPLQGARGNSQSGNLACSRQRLLQRDAFNPARFQFFNAAPALMFPCGIDRWVDLPVPGDENTIHQFGHNLAWHFSGFFNDLIQRHRHRLNVVHPWDFDNHEAKIRPMEGVVFVSRHA